MKKAISTSLSAIGAGLLLTSTVIAQEATSTDPFKIADLSCFDVVSLAEEDSLFVTAMLIGYQAGKNGSTTMTPKEIEDTVLAFDQKCLDNPDMKAIDAL